MAAGRRRRGHARVDRERRQAARQAGRRARVPADVQQSARSQQLLHRDPGRRRRHRGAGLGRHARAHVPALRRAPRLQDRAARRDRGRGRRHQGRDPQDLGRLRLRHAAHRNRHPPPGAQVAVRFQRAPPHLVRQRVRLSRSRRQRRGRDQPGRPAHRRLPRLRAPAASTSTRPSRRCASPTCRPTSSCRARTTAASIATAPSASRCSSRGCSNSRCAGAWPSRTSSRNPRPTSAGATRSAATCSTSRASRICAPTSRSATPRPCSTATSTTSSPPASSKRLMAQTTAPELLELPRELRGARVLLRPHRPGDGVDILRRRRSPSRRAQDLARVGRPATGPWTMPRHTCAAWPASGSRAKR